MRTQRGETDYSNPFYFTNLILISFTLILSGCGERLTENQGLGVVKSSIIVGSLDWKEITSLSITSQIRQHSAPVGDVNLPAMGSRCTGFLISKDVFMTNHHCIPSASYANGVTVIFNHLSNIPKRSQKKYDCSTFIGNDKKLDFALLKCAGDPGEKYSFVNLSEEPAQKNDSIYIVQQNCDYYSVRGCDFSKKYSKGSITDVKNEYTHNGDTLGGSSGSPVFSVTTNEVIGIHHAGYGNNGYGRGVENYAVPMHKIVNKIYENFPTVDIGEGDSYGGGSNTGGGSTPTTSYEPNNSYGAAAVVTIPFSRPLEITTSIDTDYFKFYLPSQGKISVNVSFKHNDGDIDVKLMNGSKNVVSKSESATSNESLLYTVTKSGIYYVKVFGYRGAKAKYKIDVNFEKVVTDNEPNDSFKKASKVFLPVSLKKVISTSKDYDFYTFSISQTAKVSASLTFSHSKGDLDLYLVNSSEQVIDKSTSVKSTESLSRTLRSGKYYVVVLGYKGATGSYALDLK